MAAFASIDPTDKPITLTHVFSVKMYFRCAEAYFLFAIVFATPSAAFCDKLGSDKCKLGKFPSQQMSICANPQCYHAKCS